MKPVFLFLIVLLSGGTLGAQLARTGFSITPTNGLFGVTREWTTERALEFMRRTFPGSQDDIQSQQDPLGRLTLTLRRGEAGLSVVEDWVLTFGPTKIIQAQVTFQFPSPRYSPDEIQMIISRQLFDQMASLDQEPKQVSENVYLWTIPGKGSFEAQIQIQTNGSASIHWNHFF